MKVIITTPTFPKFRILGKWETKNLQSFQNFGGFVLLNLNVNIATLPTVWKKAKFTKLLDAHS